MVSRLLDFPLLPLRSQGTAFMLMENIQAFLGAARRYGVPDSELFQTADLYERRNIPQVVLCLFSLGRLTQHHQDYTGPAIGPKMSTKNERNFSAEQIRRNRDAVIGLQAGTNIGATQVWYFTSYSSPMRRSIRSTRLGYRF